MPRKRKPGAGDAQLPDSARVVVRFRSGLRIPVDSDDDEIERAGIGPWIELKQKFPSIRLRPVFTDWTDDEIARKVAEAKKLDPTYQPADFNAYWFIDFDVLVKIDLHDLVLELLRWPNVEVAYIDAPGPDPTVNADNNCCAKFQGYLDKQPDGIDARYAWTIPGGDGAPGASGVGVGFIDLERGWTVDHEDLAAQGIAAVLFGTVINNSRPHGTSVLGIVCAVDNDRGCVGIVPNLSPGSIRLVGFPDQASRPDAIRKAINSLTFGDVLLLEAQVFLNGTRLLGPIEANPCDFDVIRLATALGIIVVEAGGNGTDPGQPPPLNMDTYLTLPGKSGPGKAVLFRDAGNTDYQESWAIMVSSATAAACHMRLPEAPFGKRIDCYAWGENIMTLTSDSGGATNRYTHTFSGTSGAAAIIAGAALAVQGAVIAKSQLRLGPKRMREILSDPALGTPPCTSERKAIGVMPDLRAIFTKAIGASPKLLIRDAVGDDGTPHSDLTHASPDIILRSAKVADPQAAFGVGSGTEDSNSLSQSVVPGIDNFIYVRVLNLGGSAATDVDVSVYWAPLATLATPESWTLIGTSRIPSVPVGMQLTVSSPITWPSASIPNSSDFTFVARVECASDPAPAPAEFVTLEKFLRFVRDNRNVAWRSSQVVSGDHEFADETSGAKFKVLDFLAPGAPDHGRLMGLEISTALPTGAKVQLELPRRFYELLKSKHEFGELGAGAAKGTVRIPIQPQGKTRLEKILFPARGRNALRLIVEIPNQFQGGIYEVSARQFCDEEVVGQVSWQIRPPKNSR
jgi:hypothetical protein